MEQRVSLVTLGVRDLGVSRRFYAALGWHGQEVQDTVFVQAGSLVVVLWGRHDLAADCGVEDTGAAFGGMALAHNTASPGEVDAVLTEAAAAGATITRPAGPTPYGGTPGCSPTPTATRGRWRTTPGSPWPRTARCACRTWAARAGEPRGDGREEPWPGPARDQERSVSTVGPMSAAESYTVRNPVTRSPSRSMIVTPV